MKDDVEKALEREVENIRALQERMREKLDIAAKVRRKRAMHPLAIPAASACDAVTAPQRRSALAIAAMASTRASHRSTSATVTVAPPLASQPRTVTGKQPTAAALERERDYHNLQARAPCGAAR